MSEKIDWSPTSENFGELVSYVKDTNVTDIDINADMRSGRVEVWIRDLTRGVYNLENNVISTRFVEQFCNLVANTVNKPFNPQHVDLEADTNELRISILHESVTSTGRCICKIGRASCRERV